jgi:hypothetical protein
MSTMCKYGKVRVLETTLLKCESQKSILLFPCLARNTVLEEREGFQAFLFVSCLLYLGFPEIKSLGCTMQQCFNISLIE